MDWYNWHQHNYWWQLRLQWQKACGLLCLFDLVQLETAVFSGGAVHSCSIVAISKILSATKIVRNEQFFGYLQNVGSGYTALIKLHTVPPLKTAV